jgi:hypothetical protein
LRLDPNGVQKGQYNVLVDRLGPPPAAVSLAEEKVSVTAAPEMDMPWYGISCWVSPGSPLVTPFAS